MTISITKSSRIVALAVGAGLVLAVAFGGFAAPAYALTQAEATTIIQVLGLTGSQAAAIQALVTGGSTGGSSSCTFTRSLTVGSSGADVTCLQQSLISMGFSIPAGATGYFGAQTQAAVSAWQTSKGVSPTAGYFGPISQAAWRASTSPNPTPTPTPGGGLQGGAGDIEQATFISSLNREKVGEGANDVEVAGLEIEADGSDIEIRAVTLDFDAGVGVTDDFEDYADEVSVWFNGKEVARVDADEFEDDNDYSRTISLNRGVIIREGREGDLIIAVSALRNLDNDQVGDAWDVAFENVRFADAQGAVVTDNSTGDIGNDNETSTVGGDERQFSFESFANAANIELHISAGDDDINDARTISVHRSQDTRGVKVLSFEAEVEGDSDLTFEDLVVEFEVGGGATNLDDVATEVCLELDGDEVDCKTVPTGDNTITFTNLDLELEAGDEYEFVVKVDLLAINDGIVPGMTIRAMVTETETDLWDVEDETGESLSDSEKTGSASSDSHSLFENGIMVKAVSTNQSAGGGTSGSLVGTYEIKVDITAFGADQYIYRGGSETGSTTDAGFNYTVYENGIATSTFFGAVSDLVSSTATLVGGDYYRINEGQTRRFTLTVTLDPAVTRLYHIELDSVRFDPENMADDSSEDDVTYTIPSSQDVETGALHLIGS